MGHGLSNMWIKDASVHRPTTWYLVNKDVCRGSIFKAADIWYVLPWFTGIHSGIKRTKSMKEAKSALLHVLDHINWQPSNSDNLEVTLRSDTLGYIYTQNKQWWIVFLLNNPRKSGPFPNIGNAVATFKKELPTEVYTYNFSDFPFLKPL